MRYAATLPESGNLEYNTQNCVEPLRITRHCQYCNLVEWCCGQSVFVCFPRWEILPLILCSRLKPKKNARELGVDPLVVVVVVGSGGGGVTML